MQGDKKKQPEKVEGVKLKKHKSKKPSIYRFDKETNQWKVYNPNSSIAYNCLSRDEWGWLD